MGTQLNNYMGRIKFRFRGSLSFDCVIFDGQFISISEVKRLIGIKSKFIGNHVWDLLLIDRRDFILCDELQTIAENSEFTISRLFAKRDPIKVKTEFFNNNELGFDFDGKDLKSQYRENLYTQPKLFYHATEENKVLQQRIFDSVKSLYILKNQNKSYPKKVCNYTHNKNGDVSSVLKPKIFIYN